MAAPARPAIPGSRAYTGFNGVAQGVKGSTAQWIREARRTSGNILHNLGAYGVRNMRGKKSMSVHATGRAVDLGYSRKPGSPQPDWGRDAVMPWLERIVDNANLLGVECILDYFPAPHGRGWRCDRQAWIVYRMKTIGGAPGGQWFHVELNCDITANEVRNAFRQVFPEIPTS